jgi:Fe-S oxidoreductase
VVDQIKKSKVKRIVFTCPECLVTIRDEYADLLKTENIEYLHLSEFLESEIKSFEFIEENITASYQDPCRLGRYSNIYEQPREILDSIPGVEINELPHNKERTICCGNTAWIGCNSGTKELQKGKLQEILDTGSDNLLTACPKCFIHLKCAQNGAEDSPYKSININDIWNFVGSHLQ